jgi:hypothetical protein
MYVEEKANGQNEYLNSEKKKSLASCGQHCNYHLTDIKQKLIVESDSEDMKVYSICFRLRNRVTSKQFHHIVTY